MLLFSIYERDYMITDEQLMQGLQTCDKCGSIHPSSDLFWNVDWDEHTEKQLAIIDCMDEQGLDAICSHCYDVVFNEAMA
jgi:hypothetical protein